MGMKLLDRYFGLQEKIYQYFGYVEDWKVIPLADRTEYYWSLCGEGPGYVRYAHNEHELFHDDGKALYEDIIYTQRFLPKWVYRGADFTMVCVDTQVDLNKFLAVYDNAKERPWPDGVESSGMRIERDCPALFTQQQQQNYPQLNDLLYLQNTPSAVKTIPLPAFLISNPRPFD
jgi:hypothetical protein